ncbi:MAG: hypothetical protein U0441_35160 [Polyangiaceae bacterium]
MRQFHIFGSASLLLSAALVLVSPAFATPSVSPEIVVGPGQANNKPPAVRSIGGMRLVVWRFAGAMLQGRRVAADGSLLDVAPFEIQTFECSDFSLATAAGQFEVLSRGSTFFHTLPVSNAGALGAATEQNILPIFPAYYFSPSEGLASAQTSSTYMAAYNYFGTTDPVDPFAGNFKGVRLVRATGSEAPVDVWFTPSAAETDELRALASDGENFLLLYRHQTGVNTWEERFANYSPQGNLLASGVPECTGDTLAWNGTGYVAISGSVGDLQICLLDANGKKLGPSPFLGANASPKAAPRAVWDGQYTFVAWRDYRNQDGAAADVYGNWLLPGGAPLLPDDLAIAAVPDEDETPGDIDAALPGRAAVPVLHESNNTLRFVALDLGANGQPCGGFDCQSGYCVDGVCCNSPCGDGDPNDCLACSKAAGAAADGSCSARANGSSCDDGSVCTTDDVCTGGSCQGALLQCVPPKECQVSAGCDAATGECMFVTAPDSTWCPNGYCINGVCIVPGTGDGGAGGDTTTTTSSSTDTTTSTGSTSETPKDTTSSGSCSASPTSNKDALGAILSSLALAILGKRRVSRRRRDPGGRHGAGARKSLAWESQPSGPPDRPLCGGVPGVRARLSRAARIRGR